MASFAMLNEFLVKANYSRCFQCTQQLEICCLCVTNDSFLKLFAEHISHVTCLQGCATSDDKDHLGHQHRRTKMLYDPHYESLRPADVKTLIRICGRANRSKLP